MEEIKALEVFFENRKVGTLALTPERQAAFQYTREWIASGFSVTCSRKSRNGTM